MPECPNCHNDISALKVIFSGSNKKFKCPACNIALKAGKASAGTITTLLFTVPVLYKVLGKYFDSTDVFILIVAVIALAIFLLIRFTKLELATPQEDIPKNPTMKK